jgi:hypothetical protein
LTIGHKRKISTLSCGLIQSTKKSKKEQHTMATKKAAAKKPAKKAAAKKAAKPAKKAAKKAAKKK